ncbi:MAG TPA: DUF3276 family protein [Bacteroidales bacterium]|nr:DUF3276 family protein [Bacteroidales bacterium]
MEGQEKKGQREEIFSQVLRAGRRTYFFDVKVTAAGDYYLTVTESKKRFDNRQGRPFYEKHKIFLYKEDLDNFLDAFSTTVDFIKTEQPGIERRLSQEERERLGKENQENSDTNNDASDTGNFSNVEFEDLDNNKEEEAKE